MKEQISAALVDLARMRGVRVLFAAESGSRAWGFASPDSDWDVRFIYVEPLDWHLSLRERRDVIEQMLPGDLDLSGWELKKALKLYAGTNAALNEWLGSPIVYRQEGSFADELRALLPAFFNPAKAMHHYLSMARGAYESHLQTPQVSLKKFFYFLRAVLACRFIERHRSQPPTAFADLMAGLDLGPALLADIEELKRHKSAIGERERHLLPLPWQEWMRAELERYALVQPTLGGAQGADLAALESLYRRHVRAC